MLKIQTVIFDMGNVLVPFDFVRGYQAIEARCGIPVDQIRERIRVTGLVPMLERGEVQPRDFVGQLADSLAIKVEFEDFCDIWSSIFMEHALVPEHMLEALHKRYRLLVLSNTNAIHFDMLKVKSPLLRHFDHLILSHEVGALKPDPKIYNAALALAACPPEQCVFTDDIAEYVEGARLAGMQAIRFETPEQLERDLRALGVDW